MHTMELLERSPRKISLLLGSRPGVRYASLTDRQVMESVDCKVQAVEAFVQRHDPDIVFTIAGITAEAESLGARVRVKDEGSPVIEYSPLHEKPDPERLEPVPLRSSPLCASILRSIHLLAGRHPHRMVAATVNGPLTVTGQLLGLDRMLLLSADDPPLLRRILDEVTGRVIAFMNAQVAAGARYVHVAEPTGSLLSPSSLRGIGLPSLKRLFAGVEAPDHLHMCGNVSAHLEVLSETGADAVSLDSMVDLYRASRVLGPGIAVCGNIDSAGVLLRGSPREVADATRAMLERMAGALAYIPASSCGVPGRTPPENIDAFLRTVRSFHP
ncbi:MAG: uroporphyrinogen decarboxylase family protein [Spirochaetota bacterium]